jgi:hypothetical protein
MGVDISHLVFITLCNASDQVVDEGLDCAEGGDVLASAVVEFNVDNVLRGVRKADGEMGHVFDEFACGGLAFVDRAFGFGRFRVGVPRGPSTLTIRDLIWTLTVSLLVMGSAATVAIVGCSGRL